MSLGPLLLVALLALSSPGAWAEQQKSCEQTLQGKGAQAPSTASSESVLDSAELRKIYQSVLADLPPRGDSPSISLILPAYREEKRLPRSIAKMQSFLDRHPLPLEILLVVEKSPDQTLGLARSLTEGDPRFVVIDNQVHRGKGYAVRSGVKKAKGDFVFFTDLDLSIPPEEMLKALSLLLSQPQVDMIIGYRNLAEERSLIRQAFSWTFQYLALCIAGVPTSWDSQCGFKAFRWEVAQQLFDEQRLDGFAFDVEVLALARREGYEVYSQTVPFFDQEGSTVHLLKDPPKMLMDLIRVRSSLLHN